MKPIGRRKKVIYESQKVEAMADAYFADKENHPFSMLEVCTHIGVDYQTMHGWDIGGKEDALCLLARSIKARVATVWEKGEISPSLAVFLLKHYLNFGDDGREAPEALELRVQVIANEA